MPWVGFKPTENLNSGFAEWICAVLTTIPPRHHIIKVLPKGQMLCKCDVVASCCDVVDDQINQIMQKKLKNTPFQQRLKTESPRIVVAIG